MSTLKPMMKVNLTIKAGAGPDRLDIPLGCPDFEFIFGIGSGGLAPFEYAVAELTAGEDITIQLQRSEAHEFFEHLYPTVRGLFLDRAELFINVRLKEIGPAENREIIRAMAEMAAHGEGGCDCGGSCGCG